VLKGPAVPDDSPVPVVERPLPCAHNLGIEDKKLWSQCMHMKKITKAAQNQVSDIQKSVVRHVDDFNDNYVLRDPLIFDKKTGITKLSVVREMNKNKRTKKSDSKAGPDQESVQDDAPLTVQCSTKQFPVATAMRMSFESKESDSTLARQYKCSRKIVNKIKCAIARCYLAVQAAILSGLVTLCGQTG